MTLSIFILSAVLWHLAVMRLWREIPILPRSILSLPVTIGAIFAIYPIAFFLLNILSGTSGSLQNFTAISVCAGVALLVLGSNQPSRLSIPASRPQRVVALVLWMLVVAAAVIGVSNFLAHTQAAPHGQWDAWAIWNTKSRFIARSDANWDAFLTPDLGVHPDYPILSPLLVGGLWRAIGNESVLIPIAVGGISALGAGIALIALGYAIAQPILGLLAALFLSTTPLAYFGSFQQADIPLAYFTLLSMTALVASRLTDSRWLFLAGIFGGAALFTKNEGAPFFLALIFLSSIALVALRRPHSIFYLLLGALPGVLARAALHFIYRIENDLASAALSSGVQWERTVPVWEGFKGYLPEHSLLILLLILPIVIWNLWRGSGEYRLLVLTILMIVATQTGAYFFSYLVSPYHLAWHLGSSLNRLAFHLQLLALAALIALLAPPLRNALPKQ